MTTYVFIDQGVQGGQRYVDVITSKGVPVAYTIPFEDAITRYGNLPALALGADMSFWRAAS